MDIKTLTPEEIESLQVDAALRLIGENSRVITDLNRQIGQALSDMGQAKLRLDILKEDKRTVIEVQKALAMVVKHG